VSGVWNTTRLRLSELRHRPDYEGAIVRGYVVVFEGDDDAGYSAYSP